MPCRSVLLFLLCLAALSMSAGRATQSITITRDGTQLWYNTPSASFFSGKHQRTYLAWVTSQGALKVGHYDHVTKTMSDSVQVHQWDSPDDHEAPALYVIEQGMDAGKLLLAYSKHSSALFVQKSRFAEDISSWTPPLEVSASMATYPKIIRMGDQQLGILYRTLVRNSPTTLTYNGDLSMITSSNEGDSWSAEKVILKAGTQEYLYTRVVAQKGEIHLAWDVYDANLRRHQNLYVVRTADFRQWFDVHGNPVDPGCLSCAQVYTTPDGEQTRLWDMTLDAQSRPQLVALNYQTEYNTGDSTILTHRYIAGWKIRSIASSKNTYYPAGAVTDPLRPAWIIYPENTGDSHLLVMQNAITRKKCTLASELHDITRPTTVQVKEQTWVVYHVVDRYVAYNNYLTSLKMLPAVCAEVAK